MRFQQWRSVRVGKGIVVAMVLSLVVALVALVEGGSSSEAAAQAQPKMEATIFSYEGEDFVRTKTTMVTESGKSAVNTKLDRDTPA